MSTIRPLVSPRSSPSLLRTSLPSRVSVPISDEAGPGLRWAYMPLNLDRWRRVVCARANASQTGAHDAASASKARSAAASAGGCFAQIGQAALARRGRAQGLAAPLRLGMQPLCGLARAGLLQRALGHVCNPVPQPDDRRQQQQGAQTCC